MKKEFTKDEEKYIRNFIDKELDIFFDFIEKENISTDEALNFFKTMNERTKKGND